MFGNRAIYHEGWVAATRHSIPWLVAPLPPFDQDRWELYNIEEDFSQANDLAQQQPDKLKELQDLFIQEAIRNHVLPIDDRRVERFDPALAGRPDLMGSRTSLTLGEGMTGIAENAFINLKSRTHTVTAEIEVPAGGANGVIIAQAGRFGWWSLYIKNGRAHYVYNFGGLERTTIAAQQTLEPGRHTVRYEFTWGGGARQGGTAGWWWTASPWEGRSPDDAFHLSGRGVDVGTKRAPVTEDYAEGNNRFTGRILKVTVEMQPPAARN
jgi:arylsulfatase